MFQNQINEQQIFEQWAPMLEQSAGIKGADKLRWTSKYCHFHSVNESFAYTSTSTLGNVPGMGAVRPGAAPGGPLSFYTGSTGSGDKFPSLLPLAIQVAARTIGFDIVSVIPMPGPTGVLTYLDYVYAGGKTGTEDKPLITKVGIPTFIGGGTVNNFVDANKYWAVNNVGDGSAFPAGTKAVELIYIGKSRIDASAIFRVGSTYNVATNGTVTVDNNIALAEVFDRSAVITTDNSGKPQVGIAGSANVSGIITNRPDLVNALEDHIQGYAGSGTYDQDGYHGDSVNGMNPANPMGRATGENTYYRMMGIQAFTKFVEAETFQVAASVTTEQIQDLNKQFGIDVISMVENALVNEISQSINKHITTRAFALGWTNNANMLKVEGVTMNFTVDRTQLSTSSSPSYMNQVGFNETISVNAYADYGDFENMSTIQRRILSKVLAAGNIIAQRGRRGPANFIVTNIQLATALQDVAQYTFAPMNNTVNQNNGSLYPIGTVAGMTIYVDPYMAYDDTRILVGRKGGDEEPGIKFMPYLMAESIQTIAENTMSPKIAVKSRYALVEAGFFPETQYYTIYVKTNGQPII